jgi:hypothetical protein
MINDLLSRNKKTHVLNIAFVFWHVAEALKRGQDETEKPWTTAGHHGLKRWYATPNPSRTSYTWEDDLSVKENVHVINEGPFTRPVSKGPEVASEKSYPVE